MSDNDKDKLDDAQVDYRNRLEKDLRLLLSEKGDNEYRIIVDKEFIYQLKSLSKDLSAIRGWVTFMGVMLLLSLIIGLLLAACNFL